MLVPRVKDAAVVLGVFEALTRCRLRCSSRYKLCRFCRKARGEPAPAVAGSELADGRQRQSLPRFFLGARRPPRLHTCACCGEECINQRSVCGQLEGILSVRNAPVAGRWCSVGAFNPLPHILGRGRILQGLDDQRGGSGAPAPQLCRIWPPVVCDCLTNSGVLRMLLSYLKNVFAGKGGWLPGDCLSTLVYNDGPLLCVTRHYSNFTYFHFSETCSCSGWREGVCDVRQRLE